jgi:phosphatidate cytidylyltransferase
MISMIWAFLTSQQFIRRLISALVLIPLAFGLIAYKVTFCLLVAVAFIIATYEWVGIIRGATTNRILIILVGVIYIPLCFGAFIYLRFIDSDGVWLVASLMTAVAASDIGAYMFGKSIGGPKWIPSISPNKTWAGVAGAMLGSAFALAVICISLGLYDFATFPHAIYTECLEDTWNCYPEFFYDLPKFLGVVVPFGLVLGFVCQLGDVFISLFKRRAGLKDTGALIPGHGGLLDRIDSLMLAALFSYLVVVGIDMSQAR